MSIADEIERERTLQAHLYEVAGLLAEIAVPLYCQACP